MLESKLGSLELLLLVGAIEHSALLPVQRKYILYQSLKNTNQPTKRRFRTFRRTEFQLRSDQMEIGHHSGTFSHSLFLQQSNSHCLPDVALRILLLNKALINSIRARELQEASCDCWYPAWLLAEGCAKPILKGVKLRKLHLSRMLAGCDRNDHACLDDNIALMRRNDLYAACRNPPPVATCGYVLQ